MLRLLLAAVCGLTLQLVPAVAADYPSKPVTLLVPFGAGGPADTLARMLGQRMQTTLGQNILVENVPGAAGSLGVRRVVSAAPDGYTIGIGHLGTHVFNGALYALQYDVVKDLEPIALLPSNVYAIVTNPAVPANDIKGLVAWLKANPRQATVATAGNGSIAHLATIYFQHMTGARLQIVPYRGGAQALADVVGGHVTLYFDQLSGGSLGRYSRKELKPFAVMSKKRLPLASGIPTVDEVGLPGLYVSAWYGFWAPKGTPKAIIARLNAAVNSALADPKLHEQLKQQAAQFPPADEQTPAALGAFQRAEIAKWWPIIKAANIEIK